MENTIDYSGLQCLQLLLTQLKRNINFAALVTAKVEADYRRASAETLMALAGQVELAPETVESLTGYIGPVLLEQTPGHWILLPDSRQSEGEYCVIFDPSRNQGKPLRVAATELRANTSGVKIVFRNLQEVDGSRQTALYCLCAIARHHEVPLDIRRLMHDYAIGEEEPGEAQFCEIASANSFKIRKKHLSADDLFRLGHAYPAMLRKNNGRYAVLCGARRKDASTPPELVVLDPENVHKDPAKQFCFFTENSFSEAFSGEVFLLKRIYALTDENRPFGLAWFIPEFLKMKRIFAEIALTVAMTTLLSLVIPLFFQIVVDKVLVNKSYNTLNVLGIGIVFAVLFNGFLEFVRSYLLLFATNKIDISTAMKTFRKLMRLPVDFFERVPSGVLLKHMQQTEKIRGFLSGNLFFTLLDLISLVIFIPFLLLYSASLTLVVLGYSLLMALVIASLIKPFQHRLDELYQAEGKRQSMLVEAIHGIRTVKSLSLEPVEEKHWDNSSAHAIKSYFRVGEISLTAKSISKVLEMLMSITVIWYGAHLVFDFKITVGALIAFQMLANRVTGPLVKLVGLIHEYQQIALSVKMLGRVMNSPVEPQGGGIRNPLGGAISFDHVSFQYRPDLPTVIKDLALEIPKGSTIGIVGRSGSGKSTVTKLLQGLYPVQMGVIRIDGIDIREIDKAHLRSSIGVVLQDNYFFSGTVRENIRMTKRSAALEEVIHVAKLAGADEFIQKLPKGYDTVLEENASNLSGGQRQRLAIARALLTNPPILIFDEATSALDPESEYVIQKNLKFIARGRTVLIVSHRLSIVSGADRILVIDGGVGSAFASHDELIARPGTYRDFWYQQMGRAIKNV